MDFLLRKYPDLEMICSIYNDMVQIHNKADQGIQGDDKYRPLPVLLGVLYKLQQRNENIILNSGQKVEEGKDAVLHTLGYLWHLVINLGKKIRENINNVSSMDEVVLLMEKNRELTAADLGVDLDCVPVLWVSELSPSNLEDHCPDHVVTLHKDTRCVILTILGTRMFPRPNPPDVIMDLAAKTMEFENGQAHAGMVMGARNLLKQSGGELVRLLEENQGFQLIIIGYSLGAGIAQLVTLCLMNPDEYPTLPAGTVPRTVVYGCPPVYGSEHDIPQPPNILVIQYHNDGICGASLKSINDVFLKTRAIHRLNLKRRTLFRIALARSPGEEAETPEADSTPEEDVERALDDDGLSDSESDGTPKEKGRRFKNWLSKDKIKDTFNTLLSGPSEDKWRQIEEAISNIPDTTQPRLYQVCKNVLVLKKKETHVTLRKYTDLAETSYFSEKIRFKPSMFDHHMPWSYNALFRDYGTNGSECLDLGALDSMMDLDSIGPIQDVGPEQGPSSRLYPDLTDL